jgi:methionyl-tRNA formyltransferase
MLPEIVWSMPVLGSFNLHGSLLPQYRGAAPINWAIINGEKETGVTTFFLKHEIDTGTILFQEREPIHDTDNVGTVYDRLMAKGALLVLKTVRAIETGQYPTIAQPENIELKHAPKIQKETCEINWNLPSKKVQDFVRGLSPYPSAWSIIAGKTFKIQSVSAIPIENETQAVGTIKTDNKTLLWIKTIDGWVSIEEFQPEGKKKMNIQDFFRGNKL